MSNEMNEAASALAHTYWDSLSPEQRSAEIKRRWTVRKENKKRREAEES